MMDVVLSMPNLRVQCYSECMVKGMLTVSYLTILMTLGSKRCPLEGAILLYVQV